MTGARAEGLPRVTFGLGGLNTQPSSGPALLSPQAEEALPSQPGPPAPRLGAGEARTGWVCGGFAGRDGAGPP